MFGDGIGVHVANHVNA